MPYIDKYKKKGSRYEDERSIRAAVKDKERREARHNAFVSRRNIEEKISKPLVENVDSSAKGKMGLKLLQWKQKKEREKQEASEKMKKRPPFIVGVVHHKLVPKFPSPVNSGRRNRSCKEEKSFAPKNHEFKAPSSVVPVTMVPSRNMQGANNFKVEKLKNISTQASFSKINVKSKSSIKSRTEVQPRRSARLSLKSKEAPEKMTSQKNIPHSKVLNLTPIEESGVQSEVSEEEENDLLSHPIIYAASFSPYICKARGKDQHQSPAKKPNTPLRSRGSGGLRKQIAKKIINDKLNSHPDTENEEKWLITNDKLTVTSNSDDQSISTFRKLYSDEMAKLGSLCLNWDALLMSQEIPIEVKDSIRSTVCQSRLLMREKLAQFKDLVERSANPSVQCKVTHSDLLGFWDLVSIQIEDVNNKFKKLEDLKGSNWMENTKEEHVQRPRIRKVTKEPMKTKNMEKKSAFQLFLLEQKRKKEEVGNQTAVMILTPSNKVLKSSEKTKRKSARSASGYKEGASPAFADTPKKVRFEALLESSKLCTPTTHLSNKRRSSRIASNVVCSSDEVM